MEKKFRTEVIDLVKYIIDRSGMRSLITLIAVMGMEFLYWKGVLQNEYVLATTIISVTLGFFIFRHYEKKGSNNG